MPKHSEWVVLAASTGLDDLGEEGEAECKEGDKDGLTLTPQSIISVMVRNGLLHDFVSKS